MKNLKKNIFIKCNIFSIYSNILFYDFRAFRERILLKYPELHHYIQVLEIDRKKCK